MMHGWIPPERYLAYLTWTDIRDLSDKEYDLLINKMDQVFKVPRRPKSVTSILAPKSGTNVPPSPTNGSP